MNTNDILEEININIPYDREMTDIYYPSLKNNNEEMNFDISLMNNNIKWNFKSNLSQLFMKFDNISKETLERLLENTNLKCKKIKKLNKNNTTKKQILQEINSDSIEYSNYKNKAIKEYTNSILKFKNDYINYLNNYIQLSDNRFLSLRVLKQNFEETISYKVKFGVKKITHSTFYNWISNKSILNYSYKKTSKYFIPEMNSLSDKEKRFEYAYQILLHRMYDHTIIYIDETGFKISDCSNRGWAKRGVGCKLNKKIKQSKNITLLAAITSNKVISFIFFKRGTSGNIFYLWLLNTIKMLNLNQNNTVFILDNLKSHYSKKYYPKLKIYFQFLFLPPYLPMVNPIEYMFSYIKRITRRIQFQSEEKLMRYIKNILININESILFSFQQATDKYILKMINMESL